MSISYIILAACALVALAPGSNVLFPVPEITPDGIVLTSGSAGKKLTVQGGNVTYKIWSNNLEDYDDLIKVNGKPLESPINSGEEIVYICGYEIDIPAGTELALTATLK